MKTIGILIILLPVQNTRAGNGNVYCGKVVTYERGTRDNLFVTIRIKSKKDFDTRQPSTIYSESREFEINEEDSPHFPNIQIPPYIIIKWYSENILLCLAANSDGAVYDISLRRIKRRLFRLNRGK
ncbi:MAG: hypothetical protein HOE90_01410 [Bacteriovoracaceae bacterium]|mgnify:CR=1 FL=1|jgi:hypothetical protein|nr:hypothetical protein [Bacteriovoracaceae bacterium]